MRLEKIFVKNFLSYSSQQEIELKDKTIIVGENGSGTSNLIRIIDFIISNSSYASVDWYQYPFWNTREKSLAYLDFELKDTDIDFLKKSLPKE